MHNNKFNNLHLALPTVGPDAQHIIRGGNGGTSNEDFIEVITIIGSPLPDFGPGGGVIFDPIFDPIGDDPGGGFGPGGGGGGGGGATPPADDAPPATSQDAVDIATGNGTQSDMDQLSDAMSSVASTMGLLAGVKGLIGDALAEVIQHTTGALASDVRSITVAGKSWGIVSVALGGVDVFYGFADGSISNADLTNAVGLSFGVASLIASGPVGLAFGTVSLGIGIYSAANSGGGSGSGPVLGPTSVGSSSYGY